MLQAQTGHSGDESHRTRVPELFGFVLLFTGGFQCLLAELAFDTDWLLMFLGSIPFGFVRLRRTLGKRSWRSLKLKPTEKQQQRKLQPLETARKIHLRSPAATRAGRSTVLMIADAREPTSASRAPLDSCTCL